MRGKGKWWRVHRPFGLEEYIAGTGGVHSAGIEVFRRVALVSLVCHPSCAVVDSTLVGRIWSLVQPADVGCRRKILWRLTQLTLWRLTRLMLSRLLWVLIVVSVLMFGVGLLTSVFVEGAVTVVIEVIGVICMDGVIGCEQWRCACVCVLIATAIIIPSTSVFSFLSPNAAMVGGVPSTVPLAVYFIDVLRATVQTAFRMFLMNKKFNAWYLTSTCRLYKNRWMRVSWVSTFPQWDVFTNLMSLNVIRPWFGHHRSEAMTVFLTEIVLLYSYVAGK